MPIPELAYTMGYGMPSLNTILNGLEIISLVLIAGGTVVMGALIAPLIFKAFSKKDASKFMIKMFEQFDEWLKLAAGLLLASKLTQSIFVDKFHFMIKVANGDQVTESLNLAFIFSLFMTLAIGALSLHIVFRVSPELKKLYDGKKDRQSKEFNELHKQSEMLHKVNFLLAMLLILSYA